MVKYSKSVVLAVVIVGAIIGMLLTWAPRVVAQPVNSGDSSQPTATTP